MSGTLDRLAPGSAGRVTGIDAPVAAVRVRLGDLGFTVGARVKVVRRAPLRDPTIYRVGDSEICLRRAQAMFVRIELIL